MTVLPIGRYRRVRASRGVLLHGMKMMRAPQGYTKEKPLVINGKPYIGGQVIPSHEIEKLTPEEKQKLEGQTGHAGGSGSKQNDADELQSKIDETISRIKGLEKAGYGPGTSSYDDRVRELNLLTQQRNRIEEGQEDKPSNQVKIETSPDLEKAAKELFPGSERISPETLHSLIGSPGGEVAIAARRSPRGNVEVVFSVRSEQIRSMERKLFIQNGRLIMRNVSFFIDVSDQGRGLGLQTFAKQVQGCLDAGVNQIVTHAGKDTSQRTSPDRQMNGYYTWPLFGYDAPLGEHEASLPPELQGSRTILDLMDKPGGREWWYTHGDEIDLTFDLSPGSRSLQVLNRYLEKKGQPGLKVGGQ